MDQGEASSELWYRARCCDCPSQGQLVRRLRIAEAAARRHADDKSHTVYVGDDRGNRIFGTTYHPGRERPSG